MEVAPFLKFNVSLSAEARSSLSVLVAMITAAQVRFACACAGGVIQESSGYGVALSRLWVRGAAYGGKGQGGGARRVVLLLLREDSDPAVCLSACNLIPP